ncbi:MAG: methyltransferase [Chloroflexota bacterium]
MSAQEPVNIWTLTDLTTPWCIHVVATLHVAEHIAAGKVDIADIAQATNCDAYALHRVLTHLVGKGVFEEPSPGKFALNQAAKALLDPGAHISLDLDGIGGRMAHAWGTLLTYVRTGRSGYSEVFGLPFWEDLDAHPEVAASFDAMIGPAGHGTPNINFNITGGWDSIRTVTDVGGGTGALLAEILRAHPHLHGTLVDQPRTVARSSEIFQAAGVTERVTAVGQSFFDALPAGADLYVLKSVLNDLPDEEAHKILKRLAEAARPDGRVLILGGVFQDDAPRDLTIEMVLLGGKYRTLTEFQKLAGEVGLEIIAAEIQPSGHFAVECRPT